MNNFKLVLNEENLINKIIFDKNYQEITISQSLTSVLFIYEKEKEKILFKMKNWDYILIFSNDETPKYWELVQKLIDDDIVKLKCGEN